MSLLGDLFQRLVRFILDRICLLMELLFYTDNQAYLPPITDPLLLQPATILAAQIKSGKLKSETVVQAFISRIREVQPLINSIIDERFEAALEEARTLDATIAKQLAEKGELDASLRSKPFLGVPYTGKDGLAMKGLRFSCGMPDRKNIRSDEDSSIAKLWAEAGAIPLAMTNVPELLLWWDTVNKSFGRTHNPYNRALIPGGSTGGNASLISSAGSVMGIASDIGGSTRLPAYFCGVYGHACSVGSVPTDHQWPPFAPSRLRMVSYGPMCRYAADLRPLVQMYMSKAAGKKEFSSLKLNEQVKPSQLKVFYLTSFSDPSLSPTDKPLVRAIQAAARHLQSLGATVREVKAAEELTGLSAGFDAWMVKMFEDDTLPFSLELTNRNGHLNIYWELAKALVGLSEHTLPILFTALFQTLKKALPGAQAAREHCLAEHGRLKAALHRLLGDDGVLLLPTYPELSVKPVSCFLKFNNTVYAGVFNTLQTVMTSIPLGLTIEEDGVRGGPVPLGIQAVAKHCNDHLTLTVAELLDRQFGGWAPPTKVMIK